MMSYANYLYIAIRAAVDAGKSIMDIYNDPESDFGIERKADNSPLTKADKAAHRLITNALSVTPFPVLSEEGKEIPFKERSKWETLWIVDPLDGTKEFIKKNGEFTVNIALVEKGVPVLGVIYVPVRKELYFASSSVGAYKFTGIDSSSQPSMDEMKQRAIRLPIALAHQGVVVVASRSHQTEETTAFIDNLASRKPVTLISSGSSLKICLVAEGSADIYPVSPRRWNGIPPPATPSPSLPVATYIISHGKTPLRYNKEDLHNPWFIVK